MNIRRLTVEDLPRLREYWRKHWGDDFVVAHGVIYRPETLNGFLAIEDDEWVGEITYSVSGDECEIVSLDSLRQGHGIGTKLMDAAVDEARTRSCRRVFLITTNDNLHALGFYQRRGFDLVRIHRHALDETRKLKPGIPLIGMNHIPLRDEIELELMLK